MIKTSRLLLLLFVTASLGISGCTGDANTETTTTVTSSAENLSSSASSTTSSAKETVSSDAPSTDIVAPETLVVVTPDPVLPASVSTPPQQVTAPHFIECIYGGGSWTSNALMSDGSFQWAAQCQQKLDEERAKAPYQCPQSDYFVPDLWYCDNQMVPWSVPPPAKEATPTYPIPDLAELITEDTMVE